MNKLDKFQILLLAVIALHSPLSLCRPAIIINNVMVTEPPPGVDMAAGYFEIHNAGDQPVSLVKVTSPDFGSVEMHRSVLTNGVASMIKQDSVKIPARSSVKFKPGDYHLMMLRPRKKLTIGDTVFLTFYFSDSTVIESSAIVMKQGTGNDYDNHRNH